MKLPQYNSEIFCLVAVVLFTIVELVESKEDYYEILGVEKTATEREIKSAFRKLALQYHPDKNDDPNAEVEFRKIAEAYEVLGNAENRKKYDKFGHSSAGFGDFKFNFDFKDFFSKFEEQMADLDDKMSQFGEQMSKMADSLKNVFAGVGDGINLEGLDLDKMFDGLNFDGLKSRKVRKGARHDSGEL